MPSAVRTGMIWTILAVQLLLLQSAESKDNVHTIYLTDCSPYQAWQNIVSVFGWQQSKQPGPITRIMACTPEEEKKYNSQLMDIATTYISPSMTSHPRTGDSYSAYNKPSGVIYWTDNFTPEEEWVLILDPDMLLRKPFLPEDFNLTAPGRAAAAGYHFMHGVYNELATRHVPEVVPRNDTLAGPVGRRGDMVGCFVLIHRDDLKALARDWLKYTEDVREDEEAYRLAGDDFVKKKGDKPWVSEMYGYTFAAAKANVWHYMDTTSMLYPSYTPTAIPKLMHYGLEIPIEGYSWDKHWYMNFDVLKCPPWDLSVARPQEGLFPPPPHPSSLKATDFIERYTLLLSIEVIATINAALCGFHIKHCPSSDQLTNLCEAASKLLADTRAAIAEAEEQWNCGDHYSACSTWKQSGECTRNPEFMTQHCSRACGLCKGASHTGSGSSGTASLVPTDAPSITAVQKPAIDEQQRPEVEVDEQEPIQAGAADELEGDPQEAAQPADAKMQAADEQQDSAQQHKQPAQQQQQQQQQTQQQTQQPAAVQAQLTNESPQKEDRLVRDLLKRCNDFDGLSLDQMKACVAAARTGKGYDPPEPAHQLHARGASYLQAGAAQQVGSASVQDVVGTDKAVSHTRGQLFGVNTWTGAVTWFMVIVAFALIFSRVLRRRRARSRATTLLVGQGRRH